MPKLNRTELCEVLGGWGAYIYTNFPAVRVLPARSEARVFLAFFTVARASATDLKAAPPPWWGNMARTTGGGSVKVSPHCIQLIPISRPRFKKMCVTRRSAKKSALIVSAGSVPAGVGQLHAPRFMTDIKTRLDDMRDEVRGGASRGGR